MKSIFFQSAATCVAFIFFTIGCNAPTPDTAVKTPEPAKQVVAKPDMAKIKAEIQAIETAWANNTNAGNAAALADNYSDDAISMPDNQPMVVGKAAIRKDIDEGMAKRAKDGITVAYETMEVYGDDDRVTEVGKTIRKDAKGTMVGTGKYMAIFEKRNGKFICIRDIGNEDQKAK